MLEYYWVLRSVLRAKPQLRACLTRCRHCRIFLLTHPRNAGRTNLRCPFGCKRAHRRQESIRRSLAYYRNDPKKKRTQNGRRSAAVSARGQARVAGGRAPTSENQPEVAPDKSVAPSEPSPGQGPPSLAEGLPKPVDPQIIEHVRVVVSLIEGRQVSRKEIREMLARVLRQHSIGRRRKIDHAVEWLKANPP